MLVGGAVCGGNSFSVGSISANRMSGRWTTAAYAEVGSWKAPETDCLVPSAKCGTLRSSSSWCRCRRRRRGSAVPALRSRGDQRALARSMGFVAFALSGRDCGAEPTELMELNAYSCKSDGAQPLGEGVRVDRVVRIPGVE